MPCSALDSGQAFVIMISSPTVQKNLLDSEIIYRSQSFFYIAYPGAPSAPKVVSAFKDCINLSWSPPANTGGTNILGYNIEKRKKGSNLCGQVNPPDQMITGYSFIHRSSMFDYVMTACFNKVKV